MATDKGFKIEVSSSFAEWWRYNAALMCGCFAPGGERIGFCSTEDTVADAGANLQQKPTDVVSDRHVVLTTIPCDHIVLYIYIIPHTLPADNAVRENKPFTLDVHIDYGGKRLRREHFAINQWSGASIELKIPSSDAD